MKTFAENLKSIPTTKNTVLLRLYNERDDLVSIIPNIPGRQGSIQVFQHIADKKGGINLEAAKEGLRLFGEHVEDAQKNPGKHQKLELLLGLKKREYLRIEIVESSCNDLLTNLAGQKASAEECEVFIDLLNQGKVRAAEKVKGIWEPQPYTIDGVLNYFGTHGNVRMEGKYWDKIPLKTANFTEEDFEQGGVRYAPGCMVRAGAYIGPRTVVMNLAFVNIGAYIAGDGCMIDGGARVASCAQIGKNVKFGAGSGIEGILEPAGRLASIVEDHVKIGAMCEVTGIIGEGSVIASGVIMASGKKIYDEDTGDFVPPLECVVGDKKFLLPVIPPYRLAVGGSLPSKKGKHNTDAVILKAGDLRDSATMRHFTKQGILYG
jgi:2,3,4,5-tetrahydropyridine-2-carboxylate N-succinyltransferase